MGRVKSFFFIILAFATVSYAVDAFYRHHQRTVTTSLEADLVAREIGIDGSARNSIIAKKADGTLIHILSKEMDTASLNGVLNVAGQTNLSGAVKMANYTSGRVPYFSTGGLITDASTLTYNGTTLAVNSGTYSGTLGAAGIFTGTASGGGASSGIISSAAAPSFALRETDAAADNGWWDISASSEQLRMRAVNDANSASGSFMTVDRTGTTIDNVTFPGASIIVSSLAGTGTRLTTSTSTGVLGNATTIAGANTWSDKQTHTTAPRFNSATASEFLLLDGSKDLTSVAGNGTGNVVRTTSAALVTPSLGAATATSLAATGAVSGVSLATTGGETFTYGDTSFTLTVSTGMTTTPTGTAYATKIGNVVTLRMPYITGTSNSASFVLTGLPTGWIPSANQPVPYGGATDNGIPLWSGVAYVFTNGSILLATAAGGTSGWTTSGTKATGIASITAGPTITYQLQ